MNTQTSNETSRKGRVWIGKVISNGMNKTIVVAVVRDVAHPKYKKTIKRTTKFHVHDENNDCQVGYVVKFIETRPISKTKAHKLVEIVRRES